MPRKPKPIADQLVQAMTAAERRGITRYKIAQATGISESTLGRIVNSGNMPKLDTAEAIAEAIGYRLRLERR